ncbi:MAG TPA: spherulation-specific family 4 protein, partial [Verrucomicrobiae bacterium]|nr:spherulation-specific family 4 protein [Verrucomicrobiae bacterium]
MKRLAVAIFLLVGLRVLSAPMGIVVPAYFYPPTDWDGLNFAAGRVSLVVIMNPANGPGTAVDPNYTAVVNSLHAAGGRVIGYVYSSYAGRSTNTVIADIDRFFSFYSIDGIFIDEMANDADTNHYNYYATLYQHIEAKGTNLFVMGNPGINTQEPYLATVDALLTFEAGDGYSNYVADAWVTNHLARDFCHVPYAVTNASTMTNFFNLAAARNAGWVYITDASGSNPYDRLPTYWTNEVNYIRSVNLSQPPTQLRLLSVSNGVAALRISGAPGVYELQASPDLTTWSAATMVDLQTNSGDVMDSAPPNSS